MLLERYFVFCASAWMILLGLRLGLGCLGRKDSFLMPPPAVVFGRDGREVLVRPVVFGGVFMVGWV